MDNNHHQNHYYYRKKIKEENFINGGSKTRSQNNNNNKRSSFGNGWMQQSALSLEKQFCAAVGGISWEQVLDTQKYMHQDEKVIQWEDSAVQEAFWDAKKRFLAKISGQPCDIKLPDPDVFIDKIDWDSIIDQELISDLDKRDHEIPCETEKDSGVVVGIPVVPEQFALTPMGWGDAEDQEEISRRCDTNHHWGDSGVTNEEKAGPNNVWKDDYVYVTHDMVHHGENKHNGGSKWCGGYKKKWWNHRGYNKRRNNGGWNTSTERYDGGWNSSTERYDGGWNTSTEYISGYLPYGNGYGNPSYTNYGNNNRGNFSSDNTQWKRKHVSSRQW